MIEDLGEYVLDVSSSLIGDLGEYVLDVSSSVKHRFSSVVFYFFDKRRGAFNRSSDAIRAMLAQMLHLHRHNEQAVDVASVILAKNATGQFTATDNEIFAVLSLLLELLGLTILVFDGLDECTDYSELFKRLEETPSGPRSCALLLLSRPTIQLPARLGNECFNLYLTHLTNTNDIEHFLHPKIQELIDTEALPDNQSVNDIVGLISTRANGMFLWVKLLVEYLRLPALTLRDRLEAIRNLNRLESLDNLYNAILDGLERQFPGKSGLNVRRIFQWVTCARRPLHLDELSVAVSAPLDGPQVKEDIIPNFGKSLGILSGSLIELTSSGFAQFIHLSTHEYFMGIDEYSGELVPDSKVIAYLDSADRYIAISCLSYLSYTVPAKPLGGHSQVTPDVVFTKQKFPLLEYSAEFWSDHILYSLKEPEIAQVDLSSHGSWQKPASLVTGFLGDKRKHGSWQQLASLVTGFLCDKRKITLWIEASFLFNSPRIQDLPEDLTPPSSLAASADSSFAQLSKALVDLRELSKDVTALRNSWSHVLRSEPNEIWEPSIQAFTKSRFWIEREDSRVICLAPLEPGSIKCITVQSQVSDNGSEISLIRLIPPRSV
jgi:hypothetical protein